jgi:argininosuccinate lyase
MLAESRGDCFVGSEKQPVQEALTGRIAAPPSALWNETVLQPQFMYELQHLLPHYVQIERAMLGEYERLGLLSSIEIQEIRQLLAQITSETLSADLQANMSDISFAIERYVETRTRSPCIAWHVDRSRNDVQATAQIMFAREKLLSIVEALFIFSQAVQTLAEATAGLPMPGYTHYQAAQIITVGFYMSALNEQLGKAIQRLQTLLEEINECPLGSGAMAGLELSWDRQALARALGFTRPTRHALIGVASKEWLLQSAGELSTLSVTLSRFITDLIIWGSGEYRLIDLPDQLSGISSAMPQKKNFPIMERIRGKTAHITAYYVDFAMTQRSTPYTNLVETAKEGGSNFFAMTQAMEALLQLFTTLSQHLQLRRERLHDLCTQEFFGGFTLANLLTLKAHIPYRQAQVLAGRYIVAMMEQGRQPNEVDITALQKLCREQDYTLPFDEDALQQAFSIEHNLLNKQTQGSTHPQEVVRLLALQKRERQKQHRRFKRYAELIATASKMNWATSKEG